METIIGISELFQMPPNLTRLPDDMPQINSYLGVWDTGTTHTAISRKVVAELGLKPTNKTDVEVVSDQDKVTIMKDVPTYEVNLYLPNAVCLSGITVSDGSLPGCDILIGMDVISLGDFSVTSHGNGVTWMSFVCPPLRTIDFVEELNRRKIKRERGKKRK